MFLLVAAFYLFEKFFLAPNFLTKAPEMLCPLGRLREGWTKAFSGQRVHKSERNDLELPEVPVSVFLQRRV